VANARLQIRSPIPGRLYALVLNRGTFSRIIGAMNADAGQPRPTLSADDYRNAIGRFLTGVTVVTTQHAGQLQGITASAVASVSLQPPTLLICLNRQSSTCRTLTTSGAFCVNVLADAQQALGLRFASKTDDKFAGIEFLPGANGAPRIAGALAQLECTVTSMHEAATHNVFFGTVTQVHVADGQPLAYFRGSFTRLEA
jgi:flavin reductase (DIM6/NTAB) family NADH-FMN oxidoreductase RutF